MRDIKAGRGSDCCSNQSATAAAKSLQSCPTLCDPIDGSPPGSPIPGILQARTLEQVAISFSNAWKWKVKSESKVGQLFLTPSNPMDCSLPGSSVHGIFQARVLEWSVIAFYNQPVYEIVKVSSHLIVILRLPVIDCLLYTRHHAKNVTCSHLILSITLLNYPVRL